MAKQLRLNRKVCEAWRDDLTEALRGEGAYAGDMLEYLLYNIEAFYGIPVHHLNYEIGMLRGDNVPATYRCYCRVCVEEEKQK